MHGRVGTSTDDDDMPGLGNCGCWFGGGSGLMANARGRRNRCRLSLRWIAEGRVASSKLMIGPIGVVVATVRAVEAPAVGVARSGMAKVEAAGADVICSCSCSCIPPPTCPFSFFLGPRFAEKENPARIAVSIVLPRYDQLHVGHYNTCVGIGEEEACEMKGDRGSFEGMDPVLLWHRSSTFPM
jgi:hypothetical protein